MADSCFAYPAGIKALAEGGGINSAGGLKAGLVISGATYNAADTTMAMVHDSQAHEALIGGNHNVKAAVVATGSLVGNYYVVTGLSITFNNVDADQDLEAVTIEVEKGLGQNNPPLCWLSGGTAPRNLPKRSEGGSFTVNFHSTEGFIRFRVS